MTDQTYTDLTDTDLPIEQQRARRLADDPRKRVIDGLLCVECKGSGLDPHFTYFVTDEHNPAGYWDEKMCGCCQGGGGAPAVYRTQEDLHCAEQVIHGQKQTDEEMLRTLRELHKQVTEILDTPKDSDDEDPWSMLIHVEEELRAAMALIDPEEGGW